MMARPAIPLRVRKEWALWTRVALIGLALALATAALVTSPAYAAPDDEVRNTFDPFVAAHLYAPILFTIGATGQPAQDSWTFINQTLVKTADGWKLLSILPIPAPAQ